jgi:hypothetical protein
MIHSSRACRAAAGSRVTWHDARVLMTVQSQDLRQLLGSDDHLLRAWPDHAQEVRVLVFTLRVSRPSLAEALETGLVFLDVEPPLTHGRVRLCHRSACLTAHALNAEKGTTVRDAQNRPQDVTWLAVEDVAVAEALAS